MIISMKAGATQQQVNHVIEKIERYGYKAHPIYGEERVVVGAIGDGRMRDRIQSLESAPGVDSVMPNVIALRKSQIELAGLPVPADPVLSAKAEEYDASLSAAKANLATLAAKGMKLGGKGDAWVKQTVWLGTAEFAGQMKIIDDLVPATPVGADPLLGNKPAEGEPKPENKGGRKLAIC